MKLYLIMEECMDPYFEPHVIGVFSTEEKAKKALENYESKEDCIIKEATLDEPIDKQNKEIWDQ